MKSPSEISCKLARQWENGAQREALLLNTIEWPLRFSIGRPAGNVMAKDWPRVAAHIRTWKNVTIGNVLTEQISYRATDESIAVPTTWEIRAPDEWIAATNNRTVSSEFKLLSHLLETVNPLFYNLLIRNRSIWREKSLEEIITIASLADHIEPGCAHGAPLRAFLFPGIDSKFFERNRNLITRLLDLRFDDEVSRQGLETFLDALSENDHWMLLVDLDGGILPFDQMRVRNKDLLSATLKPCFLLVVENERCLHLLPKQLPNTLAILGTGGNLSWLSAPWVQKSDVAYWGDIDTWGLRLLANARQRMPNLTALLMNRETYNRHAQTSAVVEPVPADPSAPGALRPEEKQLYDHLLHQQKGRLEQEYMPKTEVSRDIQDWHSGIHVNIR